MNTFSVAVSVLFTLTAVFSFFTWVAVGNLHRAHNELGEALTDAHNWTQTRLHDLSDLIESGINVVTSSQDGDGQ